mmetsp:Transcript_27719/g.78437  ORF Transcript_27719/g.78437 Transcript_27719/m.78437 type:complete len:168 (+) Transcript_27719:195-698(+)
MRLTTSPLCSLAPLFPASPSHGATAAAPLSVALLLQVKPSYNPDKPALPPYPTDGNLTTNPDVLLRVLAHRADRTISKLLKTHYNLPRGLDASEMYRAKAKLFQGMLGFSSAGAGGSGGSSSYYNPGGSNRLSPLRAEAGDKPRKSRSSFNVLSKSMGKPRWGKKGS